MDELKPCPFCGHYPKISVIEHNHRIEGKHVYYTEAKCMGCHIAFRYLVDREVGKEAAKKIIAGIWNRRADNG